MGWAPIIHNPNRCGLKVSDSLVLRGVSCERQKEKENERNVSSTRRNNFEWLDEYFERNIYLVVNSVAPIMSFILDL